MTQTADNATTQNIFERNMQTFRQEYQKELQQKAGISQYPRR